MSVRRPALMVCLPFICGILAGKYLPLPLLVLLMASFCLLGLVLLFRRHQAVFLPLVALLILDAGALRMRYDDSYRPESDVSGWISVGRPVLLVGSVCQAPRLSARTLRFAVEARRLQLPGELPRPVTGTVLVSAWRESCDTTRIDSLDYGRRLLLAGELAHPRRARNPGEFDMASYLHLNGIDAVLYVEKFDSSSILCEVEGSLEGLLVRPVRHSLSMRLDRLIGGQEGLFLKGLVVGERAEIPLDVESAFINAGVMHIIAVSGLHVVIVVLMLVFVLKSLRIPELPRDCLICVLLVYYIYLTGAAASVARSCIMAIIFIGGRMLQRRSDMYNTLAASALLLLVLDARQLFQPGFQLSYAAVFSLVFFYPRIIALKSLLPPRLRDSRIVQGASALVGVSVASSIGTLPFTAACFGQVSIVGFLTNIVAVPLSNVILGLGMFTLALSYIWWWLSDFFAQSVSLLTWLLLRFVQILGGFSFASVPMGMTFAGGLLYYVCLAALFSMAKPEARKWSLMALLAATNILVFYLAFTSPMKERLRIVILDVGQGDAVLVGLPGGRHLLVDAGPRTSASDAGERFVLPYLKRSGVRSLESVIISHLHGDHIGGVPVVLRGVDVGEVTDAGSLSGSSLFGEYLRLLDSLHIGRRKASAGQRLCEDEPDVRMYVLHPSGAYLPRDSLRRPPTMNNQSLVLKIVYGRTSILLPGDAEEPAQGWMARTYGDFLSCQVMKLPHHGSSNAYSPEAASLIRPSVAVISVGLKNAFGHPSGEVVSAYSRSGCVLRRTDESGAVILESDGDAWSIAEWH